MITAKMVVSGVPELLRALALTDEGTRKETIAVIDRGTRAVAAEAESRVPKVTGELAWTVRAEFSADKLTGFAKAGYGTLLRRSRATNPDLEKHRAKLEARRLKARLAPSSHQALGQTDLGVYAPVVERGDPRRHHHAHPFLIPSLQDQTPGIIDGLEQAPIKAGQTAGLA